MTAEEKRNERIALALEDIAHSLRIISGRSEKVDVYKKETYADKYFAPSMAPNKKTTAD